MEIDECDLSDWLEGRWVPAGFPERSDVYRPDETVADARKRLLKCLRHASPIKCCGTPMVHGGIELGQAPITACMTCGKGLPLEIAAECGIRANRLRDRDEENLTLLLPVLGSVRLTPEAWLFLARKFAEFESLEAAALAALNHGGLGVWMNSEKKSAVLSARDSRIPQAKALGAARLWDDKKILAFLKNSA
jgi:hypothetical protein